MNFDGGRLDQFARVARVLSTVLGPRLLDDQGARGHGRLVRQDADTTTGWCVVNRLKN